MGRFDLRWFVLTIVAWFALTLLASCGPRNKSELEAGIARVYVAACESVDRFEASLCGTFAAENNALISTESDQHRWRIAAIPSASIPLQRWLYIEESGSTDVEPPARQFVACLQPIFSTDSSSGVTELMFRLDLYPIETNGDRYVGAWRDPEKLAAVGVLADRMPRDGQCSLVFCENPAGEYVEVDASMLPPEVRTSGCRPGIVAINPNGFDWKESELAASTRCIKQKQRASGSFYYYQEGSRTP